MVLSPVLFRRAALVVVASSAVALACSGSDSGIDVGMPCTPDLPSLRTTIFEPSCATAGCHDATGKAAGIDFTADDFVTKLEGAPSDCGNGLVVIAPGSPQTSTLLRKLDSPPVCGSRMPQGKPSLTDAQKACIRTWIEGLTPSTGGGGDGGATTCTADTQSDPKNCGACGKTCATSAACVAGSCTCPAGASTECVGACVDLQSDAKNCGACGNACPSNAKFCNAGACSASCGTKTACPDGSCVDTQTSFTSCGACGKTCGAGQTCTGGVCSCPNGGLLCGGACVASDAKNCGACGNACAPGQTCSAGKCTCGTASVSFVQAVQPIFSSSCASAGCHVKNPGPNGSNLDLSTAAASHAGLVNVKTAQCNDGRLRVKPGDPATSYLIDKLTNTGVCFGTEMPKRGSSLPSSQIVTISNWICAGAPNN